jgi:SAM-dependent methyltransferase
MSANVLEWVEQTLNPRVCTTDVLWYDHMVSQSDRSLPIIYQTFDAHRANHWSHRGWLFDFLHATGSGKVLDFGPGDGWPSLILAPFVDAVVGVDGSRRRVAVCRENARRLGIANATFIHVAPGSALPFENESFDGIAAASSVEQTPDPYATLQELYRVLRPGGKLRLSYEALSRYRGKPEQGAWLLETGSDTCRLLLSDRHADLEQVVHYGLDLSLSLPAATVLLSGGGSEVSYQDLTVPRLEQACEHLVGALTCTLTHPGARTFSGWLDEIGFQEVHPSYSGGWYAWQLHGELPEDSRPQERASLDAYLRPLIASFVGFAAPLDRDTPITATK